MIDSCVQLEHRNEGNESRIHKVLVRSIFEKNVCFASIAESVDCCTNVRRGPWDSKGRLQWRKSLRKRLRGVQIEGSNCEVVHSFELDPSHSALKSEDCN